MKNIISRAVTSFGLTSFLSLQGCQSLSQEPVNGVPAPKEPLPEEVVRWRAQHKNNCIPVSDAEYSPRTPVQKKLQRVRYNLAQSRLFEATAQAIKPQQVAMCDKKILGDTGLAAALYRVNERVLFLDTAQPVAQLVVDAAHETRHAWQAMIDPTLAVPLDNFANMKRLFTIEPDAEAFAKAVTWELKQNGVPEPWAAGTRENGYDRVATAFEQVVTTQKGSPAALVMKGMRAAYDSWVANESLRGSYYLGNWDFDKGCILHSGPAINLAISAVPGVGDGKTPYLGNRDTDSLHNLILSDAQRLAAAAKTSPNLTPAKKQQWVRSFTCAPGRP